MTTRDYDDPVIARILLIAVLLVQMIAPAQPGAHALPATEACCCEGESCGCEGCGCASDDESEPRTPAPAQCPAHTREMSWVPIDAVEIARPPVDVEAMATGVSGATRGIRALPNEVSLARVCVRRT